MRPLSPSQKNVLRVRGLLASVFLLLPAGVAETAFAGSELLPSGPAAATWMLLALFLIFIAPGRRYRSWGYEVTGDELHIQSGIWIRSLTMIPFGRVQHIDVGQGPVERRYGVGTLTLHTAGTRNAAVALPGLEMGEAERLRDEIRSQIRQDLV